MNQYKILPPLPQLTPEDELQIHNVMHELKSSPCEKIIENILVNHQLELESYYKMLEKEIDPHLLFRAEAMRRELSTYSKELLLESARMHLIKAIWMIKAYQKSLELEHNEIHPTI